MLVVSLLNSVSPTGMRCLILLVPLGSVSWSRVCLFSPPNSLENLVCWATFSLFQGPQKIWLAWKKGRMEAKQSCLNHVGHKWYCWYGKGVCCEFEMQYHHVECETDGIMSFFVVCRHLICKKILHSGVSSSLQHTVVQVDGEILLLGFYFPVKFLENIFIYAEYLWYSHSKWQSNLTR